MKSIKEINQFVDMYLQAYSLSEISRELGASELTIKKYIDDFIESMDLLVSDIDIKKRYEILKKWTEGPSYNTEKRGARAYTDDDLAMVSELAEGREGKTKTKLFHEAEKKGLYVSYSTFIRMLALVDGF